MDPAFEMHHLNSWKTYSDGGGGGLDYTDSFVNSSGLK